VDGFTSTNSISSRSKFVTAAALGAAGMLPNTHLLAAEPEQCVFDGSKDIIKAPDNPEL
jgi:hypothetical protein